MAGLALGGLGLRLGLGLIPGASVALLEAPLYAVVLLGGVPLLLSVGGKLLRREGGADFLAAISIAAAAAMGQPLVAAILVLMLSGGSVLEGYAARRASSALEALARRMPRIAHRKTSAGLLDAQIDEIKPGDALVVMPHELCPVDGVVVEGQGRMDESYLTGEPYEIAKAAGSRVLSGAVNGEAALTIEAGSAAVDSRYARIMRVMEDTQRRRPRVRRLADRLAAIYAPLALLFAAGAWAASGDAGRFLAVLVVATPCPLLIAVPVAVIGAISLAARRGIIIRDPSVLEQITQCRTLILDKTGTLTYGKPSLTEIAAVPAMAGDEALRLAASLERYSRHPLARAILDAAEAKGLRLAAASEVSEAAGRGLSGRVEGRRLLVAGRAFAKEIGATVPAATAGLECLLFVDGAYAALLRFADAPRTESRPFLRHLPSLHKMDRILLVSGDQEAAVRDLAARVGISEAFSAQTPEQKVAIVTAQRRRAKTMFVGDGVNDAPALAAATVGVAIGQNSDVTSEAAGAVIMTASIGKIDELLHIGRRMRAVALQSAIGGMALSFVAMGLAAAGWLPPVAGAVTQELIDLAAVLNALRAARAPARLTDF